MVKVAHLTVVFGDHVNDKGAHHLTDEIATEALSFPAVTAVKCEVAELGAEDEEQFWREADGE